MKIIPLEPGGLYDLSEFHLRLRSLEVKVVFCFRDRAYSCMAYVDNSEDPCYLFVILLDDELIAEFGSDVTIEIDCVSPFLRTGHAYVELCKLQQAIFDGFKNTSEYILVQEKMGMLKTPPQPFTY